MCVHLFSANSIKSGVSSVVATPYYPITATDFENSKSLPETSIIIFTAKIHEEM